VNSLRLPQGPPAGVDLDVVRAAMDRARRLLWQTQRNDGSWDAPCDLGPACTAQALVALRFVGRLDPRDAADGARWLCGQQQSDGSFVAYPYAPEGDLCATACAWAALRACGLDAEADPVRRARAFIERHGGTPAVLEALGRGNVAALFLAVAGLVDAQTLPRPSLLVTLPPVAGLLLRRFHAGVLLGTLQLGLLGRHLRGEHGSDLSAAASRRCLDLLDAFQNRNGSWNDNVAQSAVALITLVALRVPADDQRITRCLAWLDSQGVRDGRGLRFPAFRGPVWATAQNTLALLHAGESRRHPGIARAVGWLLDCQLHVPQPAINNRRRGAVRTGGWAFQPTNETMPDCDDAAAVLAVLGEVLRDGDDVALGAALAGRARRAVESGRAWLLGMQNSDGGWSAFVHGLPGKPPGAPRNVPDGFGWREALGELRSPAVALGDPSTEDITGRVLQGLARTGAAAADPAIRRAIAFLRRQQCPTGAWWGRWVVHYLPSTAGTLLGLSGVGADLRARWVRKAIRWVLDHQNADGGWGETPESYSDPTHAGRGPSLSPLTGLVVSALIDVGEGGSPAVARGIDYLLANQRPDGSWPHEGYLGTMVPPDGFYDFPEAARHYPLAALGRYLAQRGGSAGPRATSRGDASRSGPSRNHFTGGVLPPAELPDWADPARIAVAQGLFARRGWEIALALFCSSLPQCYAVARNARLLAGTGELTQRPSRRLLETARFVVAVMEPGALGPGGRGVEAVRRLRALHDGVRQRALREPTWDPSWGTPLNQEDLAGTLLTFSLLPLEALSRLGRPPAPAEAEAWLHAWNVVGHLLGVERQALPPDLATATQQMDALRRRHWSASAEGGRLATALVTVLRSCLPGPLAPLRVPLIRHLAGDRCADLLGLPRAGAARWLVRGGTAIRLALASGAWRTSMASHDLLASGVA